MNILHKFYFLILGIVTMMFSSGNSYGSDMWKKEDFDRINTYTKNLKNRNININGRELKEYFSPLDVTLDVMQNKENLVISVNIKNMSNIVWYLPKRGSYDGYYIIKIMDKETKKNVLLVPNRSDTQLGRPDTSARSYRKIYPGAVVKEQYIVALNDIKNKLNGSESNFYIYLQTQGAPSDLFMSNYAWDNPAAETKITISKNKVLVDCSESDGRFLCNINNKIKNDLYD